MFNLKFRAQKLTLACSLHTRLKHILSCLHKANSSEDACSKTSWWLLICDACAIKHHCQLEIRVLWTTLSLTQQLAELDLPKPCLDSIIEIISTSFNTTSPKMRRLTPLHWSHANSSEHTASSHSSYRHYDHDHVSARWLYFQELVLYANSPKMQPHISIQSLDASTDQHWVDPSVNTMFPQQFALISTRTLCLSHSVKLLHARYIWDDMLKLLCKASWRFYFLLVKNRNMLSSHTMFTYWSAITLSPIIATLNVCKPHSHLIYDLTDILLTVDLLNAKIPEFKCLCDFWCPHEVTLLCTEGSLVSCHRELCI